MSKRGEGKFDEIGYWSEIKLEIISKYAKAYSVILSSKSNLYHVYIDGFAGSGVHIARSTGEFVSGSPLNALLIDPPFKEFFFIDLDGDKVAELHRQTETRENVHIRKGDCNRLLLEWVFPRVRYEDYRRGLCLLDPYGLDLNWEVIKAAGEMRTIDLFLNFPIMDMNRNVLWRQHAKVTRENEGRMNAYWGDHSWKQIAYREEATLFGPELQKTDNSTVVAAFRKRLKEVAKFGFVPEPMPMRNKQGAEVYYLFFASQQPVAERIVKEIFAKYRIRSS